MAAPPPAPFGFPPPSAFAPLPPGWTEHVAPSGQPYFYNAITKQSTYARPSLSYLPTPVPIATSPIAPQKKEKPLHKIPIPETPWLRVKTTHGNIFFTHVDRKESVWSIPPEIADVVASMDWDVLEEQAARDKEVARLQKEMEREGLKRKADDSAADRPIQTSPAATESNAPPPKKRKKRTSAVDEQPVAIEEIAITADTRLGDDSDHEDDSDDDDDNDGSEAAFSSTSAEEAWQREMAEGLAKLAEDEAAAASGSNVVTSDKTASQTPEVEPDTTDVKAFNVPPQVNLSPDEARTLFKTLLTEKNPSPLAPFSTVMPSLITDPRYVLLPSQSDREAAFNEWCRETARKSRLTKATPSLPTSQALDSTSEAIEPQDPAAAKRHAREVFDSLLSAEVTSTRLTWDDFRRKWKKDRRFFGFGRDDREREKVFRSWLKELGERKRAQARKAELDFMELLKSNAAAIPITANSQWKDVKRPLVKDPRYDAVGSSTLREELFNTFLTAIASGSLASLPQGSISTAQSTSNSGAPPTNSDLDRKARTEKALREREEQARVQKGHLEKEIGKSKAALSSAEAETELMSFYVDAIREPTANYHELESTFEHHPRFSSSPLPLAQKRALFQRHIAHLRDKHLATLYALFLSYSPLLSSTWSSLTAEQRTSLDAALPAQKLGLKTGGSGSSSMQREWELWMSKRTSDARTDFQRLLEENSFVDFWGKAGKLTDANEEDSKLVVPGEEDLEMSEMGGGPAGADSDGPEGKADLKTLAKSITEKEIERVLKNDQRYRAFDHMPEQRMVWIKDYISALSAPGRSVHVQ